MHTIHNPTQERQVTPIPTARMEAYRRRVAVIDWLDSALASAESGDFAQCLAAAKEARKQLEQIARDEARA